MTECANRRSGRSGSALLIVLGMLAFMVVSAVGFSVFMRQSRAPSSYLRRNISARYLLKAALANALEDLEGNFNEEDGSGSGNKSQQSSNARLIWGGREDDSYTLQNHFFGIYDDPYPGCGPDNQYAGSDPRKNGDYWLKRVFCPFGPVGEPKTQSDALDVDRQTPTVPTLTLEALAYLPPAIVDDVRKVSRLTRTACWRPLPYDAGRFAYTAVNVSDFFDVNRLLVEARNSGDCRISLASLCTTSADDPTSFDSGAASALKTAVEEWTKSKPDTPYVSLADFALANAGNEYSPFTKFIGGSSGSLLNGSSAKEANGLFVTDTWFPPSADASNGSSGGSSGGKGQQASGSSSSGEKVYDLAGGHQPFKNGTFVSGGKQRSFMETLLQKNPTDSVGDIFEKNLGIGLACLYDYLDRDSIPVSLCLPTTEAVPMVVGVSAPAGLKPVFGELGTENGEWTAKGQVAQSDGTSVPGSVKVSRTCKKMGITSFGNAAMVKILTAYPFKRMATSKRTKSWKVRGLMRIFLAKDGMKSRLAADAKLVAPAESTWQKGVADGIATFVSEEKALSAFGSDVKTEQEAVDDGVTLQFNGLDVQMPVCWSVEEKQGTFTPSGTGFTYDNPNEKPREPFQSLGRLAAEPATLRPLDAEGHFYSGWDGNGAWNVNAPGTDGATDLATLPIAKGGDTFKLQMALWIQVLDGNQKVVDMVPATAADDREWLKVNLPTANDVNMKCGAGVPLLSVSAADTVDYKSIQTDLAKPVQFQSCASLWAVDPRYNWAPENWYATDDLQVSKTAWLDFLKQNYFGKDGRDRDVFMFVSDQEYLQDIGELQFLPLLQDMNGSGVFLTGDFSPNYSGEAFSQRKGASADFACKNIFWKTYTAYENGVGTDPVYALPYSGFANGVHFRSGAGRFRLNPYSDDDRVLFAALVGTPYDYYVASTNADSDVKKTGDISLDQMMDTYSFGDSGAAPLSADEILGLGDTIRSRFQQMARQGETDWIQAWDGLAWQDVAAGQVSDNNMTFLSNANKLKNPLHGVDRKYLYSFWRECFENRQQLFLIFVRAEPTAIGGGASGSLSSAQLGGRAVALVWRDPERPTYKANERTTTYRRDQLRSSGAKETFRKMKKETPAHRTRILFYHQFD